MSFINLCEICEHFMDVLVDVVAVDEDIISCQEFLYFPPALIVGSLHCKWKCEGLIDLSSHCFCVLGII